MGVLKKYSPAIACDSIRLYAYVSGFVNRSVPSWYDISGNKYTSLFASLKNGGNNDKTSEYCANLTGFDKNLIPIATSDVIEDYDIFDYGISSIGTVNYNQSISVNEYGTDLAFTIRISNSNSEDSYILNSDPIWRDYNEYYTREGEQEPYTYTRIYDEPSDFTTSSYNTYYILVPAGPITVKCIKFKKTIYSIADNSSSAKTTVYCAYFLDEDEWVTIPLGESRVIVVDFSAVTA